MGRWSSSVNPVRSFVRSLSLSLSLWPVTFFNKSGAVVITNNYNYYYHSVHASMCLECFNNLHGKCNHITLHVFFSQTGVGACVYIHAVCPCTHSKLQNNQTCQTLVQINSIQFHIMHLYDGYCSKCQIWGIT